MGARAGDHHTLPVLQGVWWPFRATETAQNDYLERIVEYTPDSDTGHRLTAESAVSLWAGSLTLFARSRCDASPRDV